MPSKFGKKLTGGKRHTTDFHWHSLVFASSSCCYFSGFSDESRYEVYHSRPAVDRGEALDKIRGLLFAHSIFANSCTLCISSSFKAVDRVRKVNLSTILRAYRSFGFILCKRKQSPSSQHVLLLPSANSFDQAVATSRNHAPCICSHNAVTTTTPTNRVLLLAAYKSSIKTKTIGLKQSKYSQHELVWIQLCLDRNNSSRRKK